ncbi:MAG TPA: ATP-binding protein [Polyangiaceae bacterium]|nr:ATP-binding protein [Polyangiaceae bacterium]
MSVVLGTLGRIADLEQGRLEEVLATITEAAAQTLSVARVNVWLYDAERFQIECIEGYDRASRQHARGAVLLASKYPSYFEALERLRSVTAMDVGSDPRTQELVESYLAPLGIESMLDVPILRSGHVIGVVCHEHVGPPRVFEPWERSFAGSIGDLVALALETERRVTAEQERTRLVARLGQTQRLESLEILAGGVAHDLKNLLMVVTGNVDALRQTASAAGQAAARDILDAVRRSKELCELLLTYAGHSEVKAARVSLGTLVVETERLLRTRAPIGARIVLDVASDVPEVTGDSTAIRQVIMNLIINAFDALIEGRGKICVRVRRDEPRRELAFDFRNGSSPSLLLEVEDDGSGMTAETQSRIFDPFFTTKPDGHGFGLASVLGIVRSHAGALEVESELGRGTTLRVWLPTGSA